jgi:hypothetical protein
LSVIQQQGADQYRSLGEVHPHLRCPYHDARRENRANISRNRRLHRGRSERLGSAQTLRRQIRFHSNAADGCSAVRDRVECRNYFDANLRVAGSDAMKAAW